MATPVLQTPSSSTANSTVSAALVAAWDADQEYVAAYYSHSGDGEDRWVGITYRRVSAKYAVLSTYDDGVNPVGHDSSLHNTLADACDDAADFLDTETD